MKKRISIRFLGLLACIDLGAFIGLCIRSQITNNFIYVETISSFFSSPQTTEERIALLTASILVFSVFLIPMLHSFVRHPRFMLIAFFTSLIAGVFINATLTALYLLSFIVSGIMLLFVLCVVLFNDDTPSEFYFGRIGNSFFEFFKF